MQVCCCSRYMRTGVRVCGCAGVLVCEWTNGEEASGKIPKLCGCAPVIVCGRICEGVNLCGVHLCGLAGCTCAGVQV